MYKKYQTHCIYVYGHSIKKTKEGWFCRDCQKLVFVVIDNS